MLEIAAEDTAPEMSAKSVANAVWSRAQARGPREADADCWEAEVAIPCHAIRRVRRGGRRIILGVRDPRCPRPWRRNPVWLEGKMADEEEEAPPPRTRTPAMATATARTRPPPDEV